MQFGPIFAAEIRNRRIGCMQSNRWRRQLAESLVKISGGRYYPLRTVDDEDKLLQTGVTKRRNKRAALKFLRKPIGWYGHRTWS